MRNRLLVGWIETVSVLTLVTFAGVILQLNAASAGFLLIIAILFSASRHPLVVATAGCVIATLCYNFFFFDPKWTLTIEDPANWIALGSFLVTSLLANRLLAKKKQEAENARASRREVEALYELSVDLLKTTSGLEIEDLVAGVGRHRRFTEIPSRFGRDVCVPLNIESRTIGAVVLRGSQATRSALESVGALIALAVERERFFSDRAHLEGLRESNELKTSLLQAVAHDLNSPLTVLSVESEAIARKGLTHREARQHFEIIREQLAQLKRRIENLLSLARVEAGLVQPRAEPTPPADLFRAARENLASVVQSRVIRTSIDPDAPDALVDPSLALEIVVNLVENAHRASPPGPEIELRSRQSANDTGRVWLEVLDRGNGFSPQQQRALRTVGLPDTDRGFGIDLARTLAILNGGSVEWFARDGGGTVARIDLPAAQVDAQEAS